MIVPCGGGVYRELDIELQTSCFSSLVRRSFVYGYRTRANSFVNYLSWWNNTRCCAWRTCAVYRCCCWHSILYICLNLVNHRAGFSLRSVLFRKKCVGPSPGPAPSGVTPISTGKKLATFFSHPPSVCQLSVLQCHPCLFSPEKLRTFLVITVAFIHFTRSPGCRPLLLMPKFHYIYLAQNLLKTRFPTSFEQKKSRRPVLVSDLSATWSPTSRTTR